MIKVFISCTMNGRSDEEILKTRKDINEKLKNVLKQDFEVIDSFFTDFNPNVTQIDPAMYYLGLSISKMAAADIVVFAAGWDKARGCKLEYNVARAYGKTCILL